MEFWSSQTQPKVSTLQNYKKYTKFIFELNYYKKGRFSDLGEGWYPLRLLVIEGDLKKEFDSNSGCCWITNVTRMLFNSCIFEHWKTKPEIKENPFQQQWIHRPDRTTGGFDCQSSTPPLFWSLWLCSFSIDNICREDLVFETKGINNKVLESSILLDHPRNWSVQPSGLCSKLNDKHVPFPILFQID